jgi:hypothetical protein
MKRCELLLGLAVAACSQGHVQTTQRAVTGTLPAPAHVVVTDFTLKPELSPGLSISMTSVSCP